MTQAPKKDALRIDDWSGEMGERWLHHVDTFESMLGPIGDALLERAGFKPGERVVDVGCGGGASARAIAARVAPSGSVVGLDISVGLVKEAARRAAVAGVSNVRFVAGDAATMQLPDAPFDRVHSRFGAMFFSEPAAAFRNLGTMVRAGGRADFLVWAAAKDSPWVSELMTVMRNNIDLPKPEPRAPGPFALDDPEYFGELLRGGGFTDLDFHLWRGTQWIAGKGATAKSAVDFLMSAMSFGDVVKEQPIAIREKVEQELLQLFRRHESAEGVGMGAIAWLVSARKG
jgi:SAM-dependent methyltransferase